MSYIRDGTEAIARLENVQETGATAKYHWMLVTIKNRMFGDTECVIFKSSEIKYQSKFANASGNEEPDYWIHINRINWLATEKYENPTERSFFTSKCTVFKGCGT